tara:strand:- start:4076 stop:4375 length:300 start_codon:yes stop_codon:yes gene_type:complete
MPVIKASNVIQLTSQISFEVLPISNTPNFFRVEINTTIGDDLGFNVDHSKYDLELYASCLLNAVSTWLESLTVQPLDLDVLKADCENASRKQPSNGPSA